MHHEQHAWFSPALEREMHLEVFGHAGARVLVFPTSLGSWREWRDRRMHEVVGDHLENGWIQLCCVDQIATSYPVVVDAGGGAARAVGRPRRRGRPCAGLPHLGGRVGGGGGPADAGVGGGPVGERVYSAVVWRPKIGRQHELQSPM